MARPHAVKGMIAVAGFTYRIARVEKGTYTVTRILDDVQVGTFRTLPKLDVTPKAIDPALLLAIARQAIQLARTSWVGQAQRIHPSPIVSVERTAVHVRSGLSSVPPPLGV